jgi:acyl dehydratase
MTDDFMTETVTHAEAGRGLRKDASFDLVEIPEPFGPVTVTIDQDKLRTFAFAVDDYSSWYFGDSPFGGPIGHPILLANDLLFLFYENYDGNTAEGLQSHERLTFHSPARVGETITVSGAYTEKYEKRGHGYVVLDAEARGEDGRLIIHHHGTEIMRTRAGEVGGASTPSEAPRRVEGIIDETLPVATRARAGLAPRTRVPGVTRRFHQDQLNSFSWLARGYRNVHTDIDSARKSGVGRTFVQALQQTELIAEAMVQFFGASWFTSGELDLRYTHPAFTGDELTVYAAVVSDDGETQELEVWIDTEQGVRTALGWARARITADTERPHQLLP